MLAYPAPKPTSLVSPARLAALILTLLLAPWLSDRAVAADPPGILNHQGRIAVDGTNFDGAGQFKFALVNGAGDTSYWSNDGTSATGDQPAAAVPVTVTKGQYSVLLGDTPMIAIPASVFADNADVRLRLWFSADGGADFEQLAPDRRIAAVGYALSAQSVVGGGNEPPIDVFPARGMAWIKPGTFLMGSRTDEPGRSSDETQHPVTLTKGFWMGVHEVTQAEYVAVIGSNPSNFTGDTNRPVETVSWTSAVAYCATLTTTEQTAGRIPAGWEYRLPTEAEWEYCCRAGARTTRFGYGDDIGETALTEYAWYSANAGSTTHPVEQKRANAWGLMDMHGNVWEWCQDWYGAYPSGSATDPQGAASGSFRVFRGTSWFGFAFGARCASRGSGNPGDTNRFIGFRVVLAQGQ